MFKHVIVTGGTGVTGNALIRYLLKQNIKVTALIRKNSKREIFMPESQDLVTIPCNLGEYMQILGLLCEEYDAFFHLAWDGSMGKEKIDNRNNMFLQSNNINYTIEAVELCKSISCPVFLATGSQAEYGHVDGIISEDTAEHPQNGYGMAKLCANHMTRVMCERYGIKHIWARLFSIYGPYDGTESLIDTSIQKLIKGIKPTYTKGEQVWDYLYSYDAAKALYLLASKGKDGHTYCIGNGNVHLLKEYITWMHEVVNPDCIPIFGEIAYSSGQVMKMIPDIKKLVEDTEFFPEYTFYSGIKEILDWQKDFYR